MGKSLMSMELRINATDAASSNFYIHPNESFYKKEDFVEVSLSGPYFILLFLYVGVCVSGLIGNGSVIFIILNFPKMKTITNLYILNLAVADVMFLIGIPFLIVTITFQGWPFGNAMCKVYWITANVNQFVSSMFCLVLSGDRFVAVYLALSVGRKYRQPYIARYVCAGVWIFALLIMIPVMRYARTVITSHDPTTGVIVYSCQIVWPEYKALINSKITNDTQKSGKYIFDPNKAFTFYTFAFGFGIPVFLAGFFYFMVVYRLKSRANSNSNYPMSCDMIERSTLPSGSGQNSPETPSSNRISVSNLNSPSTSNGVSESNYNPVQECESNMLRKSHVTHKTEFVSKRSSIRKTLLSQSKPLLKISHISFPERPFATHPKIYLSIPKPKVRKTPSIIENTLLERRKKSVKRVTNMVLTVIAVYVCSWTPYWVLQLILTFRITAIPPKTVYASMFIYCLAYANSSMNPILYAFLSNSFKNCFSKLFACKCSAPRENRFPSSWKFNCMKKHRRRDRPLMLENVVNRALVNIPIIVEGPTINSQVMEVETIFHATNI